MSPTETLILEQLAAINAKLEYLLVPVARQEARQVAGMTREENKANNQRVREELKRRKRG